MASGSRGCSQGSAVAGADAPALADTLTNPDLAHLPAVDLVAHLHRDDRSGSDFADVTLVLAARERRLAEAEARIHEAELLVADLRESIRELEHSVANAEALVRDSTVVAGEDDHHTAIDVGAAELTGVEIRARGLEIVVPELGAGAEVGDNDMPSSPIPLERIDAFPDPVTAAPALPDELIEDRAVEEVAVDVDVPRSHEVAEAGVVDRKRKKPASDLSLQLDDLRVTSHKVSEEEAHGDVPASPHRRSQGEPAKATKKARRPSFYSMVFKRLKEQEMLLKKEVAAKKAAATAPKQLHCRCYWSNSGDEESSQK